MSHHCTKTYSQLQSSGNSHSSINEIHFLEESLRQESTASNRHNRIPHERSILDLTFKQKLAIGSGHFVNDITASIWFSYFLMYSEEVVGLSGQCAAILMLIGQLIDAIATPLVGYEADRMWGDKSPWLCRSGFGRYKSWHLFGVISAVISFPFIFSPPLGYSGSNEIAKAIYYFPFIVIYEVSWAAVQISHLALIPKMNPDILVRTEILSIRLWFPFICVYVLMVVANLIVFVVTWSSVGMGKHCVIDKRDVSTFQHLGFITMGIGLLTALVFYISTKEHPDEKVKDAVEEWEKKARVKGQSSGSTNNTTSRGSPSSETSPLLLNPSNYREKRGLSTKYLNPGKDKMTVRDWVKLPQFYMVGAVYITGRLIINIPQAYLPLYLQESLHLPCSTIATIPMTYFFAGFVIATVMKVMNRHLGRQLTFGVGILMNLTGALLILWGDWSRGSFLRESGIYGVFAVLGGGASAGMVTGLSITSDMIGNNVESGAFVYGFMSFCDKFTCGLSIIFINSISPPMEPHTKTVEEFFVNVVGYSCVGCSILAILGLTTLTILIWYNNQQVSRAFVQEQTNVES